MSCLSPPRLGWRRLRDWGSAGIASGGGRFVRECGLVTSTAGSLADKVAHRWSRLGREPRLPHVAALLLERWRIVRSVQTIARRIVGTARQQGGPAGHAQHHHRGMHERVGKLLVLVAGRIGNGAGHDV